MLHYICHLERHQVKGSEDSSDVLSNIRHPQCIATLFQQTNKDWRATPYITAHQLSCPGHTHTHSVHTIPSGVFSKSIETVPASA